MLLDHVGCRCQLERKGAVSDSGPISIRRPKSTWRPPGRFAGSESCQRAKKYLLPARAPAKMRPGDDMVMRALMPQTWNRTPEEPTAPKTSVNDLSLRELIPTEALEPVAVSA